MHMGITIVVGSMIYLKGPLGIWREEKRSPERLIYVSTYDDSFLANVEIFSENER